MPVEQPWALNRHLTRRFLQLGTTAIEGQLGKTGGQGLGLFQQLGQSCHILFVGMGRDSRESQSRNQQHADKAHGNPHLK
ncbi:hypothetical protein D3C85_1814430 [compost metagenome]